MKILSIGNSFSADAHVYLNVLAKQRGIDLETVNAAIGGCSLQMHWNNIVNKSVNFLHNINGGEEWQKELVSVEQILKSEPFDVITLQQASHLSAHYETYTPYLENLLEYIKKYCPRKNCRQNTCDKVRCFCQKLNRR